MKPIPIAITQRIEKIAEYDETRDSLDRRYERFVLKIGGIPIPVPNYLENEIEAWLKLVSPKAIILTGGNDIGAYKERDFTENHLLEYSLINNIPLLAICRGLQMLVNFEAGQLFKVEGHVGIIHDIHGDAVTRGELPSRVNSFHDWAVFDVPKSFNILAEAPDKTIEAIKHKKYPWEGWMWHPEREKIFRKKEIDRARMLFFNTKL